MLDFIKLIIMLLLDLSGSGKEPVVGFYEHGKELPGSIKGGEFLD
jgi:hypothetical protein